MQHNLDDLQIILTPDELRRASRQRPAIMPLGSPLAAASADWHAPVYWVSLQHPAELVGALLDQHHGSYLSPTGLICLQVDGQHDYFHLLKPVEAWNPDHLLWLLARVLQLHLAGASTAVISAEIARHAGNLSQQVAA